MALAEEPAVKHPQTGIADFTHSYRTYSLVIVYNKHTYTVLHTHIQIQTYTDTHS